MGPPPPTGEPLELYFEDGWWEVSLQRSRQAPGGGQTYQVTSSLYGTERWASPDRLRPRWQFVHNGELEYWKAEAPDGLVVWEHRGQRCVRRGPRCAHVAYAVHALHTTLHYPLHHPLLRPRTRARPTSAALRLWWRPHAVRRLMID